jgi:hypothetical protein
MSFGYDVNDVMDELKQIKFNTIRIQFPNPPYADLNNINLRVKLLKPLGKLEVNKEYDVEFMDNFKNRPIGTRLMKILGLPAIKNSVAITAFDIITSFPFDSAGSYLFEDYFVIVPDKSSLGGAKKKSKKLTRKKVK